MDQKRGALLDDLMTTDAPGDWKRPVDIGASAKSELFPSFSVPPVLSRAKEKL